MPLGLERRLTITMVITFRTSATKPALMSVMLCLRKERRKQCREKLCHHAVRHQEQRDECAAAAEGRKESDCGEHWHKKACARRGDAHENERTRYEGREQSGRTDESHDPGTDASRGAAWPRGCRAKSSWGGASRVGRVRALGPRVEDGDCRSKGQPLVRSGHAVPSRSSVAAVR